jgi:ribonucleotide monophosphatase NagD (HAD superfamily)
MPSASDILRMLSKDNKRVYFVTNNDTLSREEYYEQVKHNFSDDVKGTIGPTQIYTSSYLCAQFLKIYFPQMKKVRLIGNHGV